MVVNLQTIQKVKRKTHLHAHCGHGQFNRRQEELLRTVDLNADEGPDVLTVTQLMAAAGIDLDTPLPKRVGDKLTSTDPRRLTGCVVYLSIRYGTRVSCAPCAGWVRAMGVRARDGQGSEADLSLSLSASCVPSHNLLTRRTPSAPAPSSHAQVQQPRQKRFRGIPFARHSRMGFQQERLVPTPTPTCGLEHFS